jgi:hypothetical protein
MRPKPQLAVDTRPGAKLHELFERGPAATVAYISGPAVDFTGRKVSWLVLAGHVIRPTFLHTASLGG